MQTSLREVIPRGHIWPGYRVPMACSQHGCLTIVGHIIRAFCYACFKNCSVYFHPNVLLTLFKAVQVDYTDPAVWVEEIQSYVCIEYICIINVPTTNFSHMKRSLRVLWGFCLTFVRPVSLTSNK